MNNDEMNFIGKEKDNYNDFIRHHVCPDREPFDGVKFETTVFDSAKSGIGVNVVVKCERCGCRHDITDYGMW